MKNFQIGIESHYHIDNMTMYIQFFIFWIGKGFFIERYFTLLTLKAVSQG